MPATVHQTETATAVTTWLSAFDDALAAGDPAAAAALFHPDCYWRDLIAFSWNIKTFEGPAAITEMLSATLPAVRPGNWVITDGEEPADAGGVIEAWIEFDTAAGRGRGHLRLRDGLCWTLLTTLYELKGHEEPQGLRRPKGVEHGASRGRSSWLEDRQHETSELGFAEQPYVLIIGGGQGGIGLGARLRQLGVAAIIIDKHSRPGDQWRGRYKSLCLHDPVWYDHLPYLKFPDSWPVFSPKDKIADWLESYTKIMELNYWGNTEAKHAAYDEAAREWTVTVERAGQPMVLRPAQLVLALGVSGKPSVPSFPGMDLFRGDQHHSSVHPGPDAYRGKTCVVIGSNTVTLPSISAARCGRTART
jgi:putative flavoprotein involved in K+ transport